MAIEKFISMAQIQAKDGLNQNGFRGNEREVIDSKHVVKVKFIIFRMEQI